MGIEPAVDAVADINGDVRVEEIGGAYLYGGGACHKELYGVLGSADATKSYDGDADGMGYLPHHTEGNGFHGGTAETTGADAETRLTTLYVDGHSHESVYKRDAVGTF